MIRDESGVTYVAPGALAPQERASLAARPGTADRARAAARAQLRAALEAAEPDLRTRLWMERVRVTARLKREGWLD
ncbi:hypothetical protein [Streptomyces hydrogenans]|uniref:hypothetical protein n=1 Tax=Streptomyces hydrogenans TaxID=1873719 RepID=UPI0037F73EC9